MGTAMGPHPGFLPKGSQAITARIWETFLLHNILDMFVYFKCEGHILPTLQRRNTSILSTLYAKKKPPVICRIGLLDMCMASSLLPFKCWFNVTFSEIIIIRIAAFDFNIPIRMTRIQNMDTTKCCWGCAKRALIHCWWGCKMGQPRGETIWQFLTKQNIDLSYDPAATLLGVYPDAWKRCACPKRCTHVGRAFVHHFQNLEAAKMSLCHWMDK